MVSGNRIIPAEMIVRMLQKIIYSGNQKHSKFILTSFPDIIEQAREFESNCSRISAIIYSTTDSPIIEIKNNNLSLFNIDSLFQKEFRLRPMHMWDYSIFQDRLGNSTEYGVIVGDICTGKSTVAKMLNTENGYVVIDMKAIQDKIRAALSTEDEPYEGEITIADVERRVKKFIQDTKEKVGGRVRFIFDGYLHSTPQEFVTFALKLGVPKFIITLTAPSKVIRERWCKINETDEVGEEKEEELKASAEADIKRRDDLFKALSGHESRFKRLHFETDKSLETTLSQIKQNFQPRVLIVNHEKRLGIDTTCANLAIKYNMIYISTYQLIKHHITKDTPWGRKLQATKRLKELSQSSQARDEFNELEYSAVHFDLDTVIAMIKDTILEKQTNQNIIILEGMCNTYKLQEQDDQLEMRVMDEIMAIERNIGDIAGIIGLQFSYEAEVIKEDDIEYEQFPTAAPEQKPAEGEGGIDNLEDIEEEKPAEEGEPAEGKEEGEAPEQQFKPEQYTWTITNRAPKNLPQLFASMKGRKCT